MENRSRIGNIQLSLIRDAMKPYFFKGKIELKLIFPTSNVASFGDFPLHVKGSSTNEWSKFEYALYLLNKNVAQLRWQCGLITVDLRPTLHNLDEILSLGKDAKNTDIAIPSVMTTSPPPSSFTAGVPLVVLKNGSSRLRSNR